MPEFNHHETVYRDLGPTRDRAIVIAGVGALGANLAETLARMGVGRLTIIDRDRVEQHNLSTQPWSSQDVTQLKAKALARTLYAAVGARVNAQAVELTANNAANHLRGADLVVDCFDNVAGRRVLSDAARALEIPVLHLALGGDGEYACALWDDRYVLPATEVGVDGCEYPLTRPLAMMLVHLGAEAIVRFLLSGEQLSVEFTLGDLQVRRA